MKRLLLALVVFATALLGASFAALNTASMHIDLYFVQADMALSLALALAFCMGALAGLLVALWVWLRVPRSSPNPTDLTTKTTSPSIEDAALAPSQAASANANLLSTDPSHQDATRRS